MLVKLTPGIHASPSKVLNIVPKFFSTGEESSQPTYYGNNYFINILNMKATILDAHNI